MPTKLPRPRGDRKGPAQKTSPNKKEGQTTRPSLDMQACQARYHAAREWSRVHMRRWTCLAHDLYHSRRRTLSPLAFLGLAACLGVTVTLSTLYSSSFAVTVDGEDVGVVRRRSMVDQAIETVQAEGRSLLGRDYELEGQVDYHYELSLKSELSDQQQIDDYFYARLSEKTEELRKYQVYLNGKPVGIVEDREGLDRVLESIKAQYITENTVTATFLDDISIEYLYDDDLDLMTLSEMEEALKANSTGDTTYEVKSGDTFNGIAFRNDMSVSDLKALNPKVDINRLMIGDVLNVKEKIPALSVKTVDHEEYEEPIPCPVETRQDSKMYKGDSKILEKGVEGVSAVAANVTYVNGYEREREILSKETVREPTATIKAVGTKERPKTASHGSFVWPIRGRITSYFGNRHIFGRTSFHSGIDIKANYGAPIKAADGGKVTFAGWKGSYGNLVIITHDNGTQTYYGHNSSLLVSAGQRVYQGQTIAKAGSTGRSTGNHCHFEVRVNGRAVNPLNYLP